MPMAAAAVAGPIIGGIMANRAAAKDRKAAQAAIEAGLAELNAIGMPPDLSARVIFEQFAQQGLMTPELEQDIQLGASAVSNITEDASLRETQMGALNMLKSRMNTGLSPVERADLNQMRQATQRDAQGKIDQIQQQMAARGQGGSGSELAASLMASQGAAERQSGESDRLMAMAAQNALNAIAQGANVAGGIRDQDYSRKLNEAEAMDMISRFNAENATGTQQRNISAKNLAQATNLGEKQRIADTNTLVENTERARMNQAKRDYFQDQLALASAKSSTRMGVASGLQQQGQQKADMWSSIGGSLGGAGSAYAQRQHELDLAKQKAGTSSSGSSGSSSSGSGTYDGGGYNR